MGKKKSSQTLQAIEELEHYLAECQLYGLNMAQIDVLQEKITNIKKIFIDEVRDKQV